MITSNLHISTRFRSDDLTGHSTLVNQSYTGKGLKISYSLPSLLLNAAAPMMTHIKQCNKAALEIEVGAAIEGFTGTRCPFLTFRTNRTLAPNEATEALLTV